LNIFKSTKKSNTIFFAALLLVGTIAASSPLFMLGAQAEPYYGMDKDGKVVSVSSLKCNNINANVNGLELDVLPPALSALLTDGEADATAYSYGSGNGNYGSESSGSENDFRFICINNNNNTVVRGGEEEEPPVPPTPPPVESTNLNVIKNVECTATVGNPSNEAVCAYVLENILPSDYQIFVTGIGNNPNPSEFPGSSTGTNVQLEAGGYIITEELASTEQLQTDLTALGVSTHTTVAQGSDCVPFFNQNFVFQNANGTISNGESQTCSITNTIDVFDGTVPNTGLAAFDINKDSSTNFEAKDDKVGTLVPSFSSPAIAQGTEEDLSALEKIEKLKKQWLELLP
jgi:hypothetical protein